MFGGRIDFSFTFELVEEQSGESCILHNNYNIVV